MTIRWKIQALAPVFFALASAFSCWAGERGPAPNIVLLVADDLGWTDLGAYGSRFYETPNIDRLAREGLRFTAAYANPNCAPTRAALLPGRYSPRTGVYTVGSGARGHDRFRRMIPAENRTDLPLDEVTFAEVLREAGYAAAHMGKWHLGAGEHSPTNQGFDVNVGGTDRGHPVSYFSPFQNPQLPDKAPGEHLADRLAAEAVRWLEDHRDGPFLLYLPFYSVHTPIQAKPELIEKYEAKEPAGRHWHPTYAAMIETLDANVGRVLDALDELGVAERTAVFFYSDNGGLGGYAEAGVDANLEVTDNAPLRGGKGMLYEGGVRVPLIVRYPEVAPAGGVTDEPVMCVDFFPTLLEIAGQQPPADRPIDGASFFEILRSGEAQTPRSPIYWHFPGYLEGRRNVGAWRTTPAGAIRQGSLKLIEFFETGEIELYDLQQDPRETDNLASRSPAVARRLHELLQDWRERIGAPMPRSKVRP